VDITSCISLLDIEISILAVFSCCISRKLMRLMH